MSETQTTTITFVAAISPKTSGLLLYLLNEQIKSGVKRYRINIASRGGDVFFAISIFNFLSGLKDIELHTHNLGQIDSAANIIFLAGHKRTANKASTFLMHPPEMRIQGSGALSLSIENIREKLESLQKDNEKMAEIMSARINKSKEDVLRMFEERKTYSSEEARALKMIDEIQEFTAEPGKPVFMITDQS